MKDIFMKVITKGAYDLPTMLARIDEYHISGQLTRQERDELLALARSCATAASGMDVPGEIQRLWAAVRALQGDTGASGVPEYVQPTGAHDAYFAGDTVLFGGVAYTCIAPEGVACVWSPTTMPDYWQAA